MSDRSGCSLVELTILEALYSTTGDSRTGGSTVAYAQSSKVLDEIEGRIGLGPRYGYELLLDLARPWMVPVPIVAAQGNIGGRNFPEPTWPEHTQCRPSQAGRLVLGAETHLRPPVPVGLINGSSYRGASRPPLQPFAVLAALRLLLNDPDTPDDELIGLVGEPWSGGGCTVTGDLAALARGSRVVLSEKAHVSRTAIPVPPEHPLVTSAGPHHWHVTAGPTANLSPVHLVIESLPGRTITGEVARAIADQSSPRHERALPIADVDDDSTGTEVRILITLRPGADPAMVLERLAVIEGMSAKVTYAFPAPLASLLRSWVNDHRDEDIASSLTDLELAIRADRDC